MSKILLVGKNSKVNNAYSLNFNMYLGLDVVFKHTIREALIFVKDTSETIELIVIAPFTNDDNTALTIYTDLQKRGYEIEMISMQKHYLAEKVMSVFAPDTDISVVIEKAAELLGMPVKEIAAHKEGDYCSIPLKYFYFIDTIVCDTFLRVRKVKGRDHFIKRFRAGDIHSKQEIKKYFEKGVDNFYVPKSDGDFFVTTVTEKIVKRLEDNTISDSVKMDLVENCRDVISGILLTRGVTEETIILAKASMKKVIEISKNNPTLKKLLSNLLKSKSSYRYRVMQLTIYVVFHIISNMEWGSGEQQDKLAFVSFFHDILLPNDKLAMIDSEEDLSKAFLSKEDEHRIMYHAKDTSEMLQKYPRIPIGAETIILRHHGKTGGIGFAKSFSNNLEPLTVVFTIAKKYSRYLLLFNESMKHSEIIDSLFTEFPKSQYKKAVRTLTNFEI